jgi:predicted nucleic acid-binding protein
VRLPDVVALDTDCFIYLFEQSASERGRFLVDQVLRPSQRGERRVVTPALVVQELLAQPRS